MNSVRNRFVPVAGLILFFFCFSLNGQDKRVADSLLTILQNRKLTEKEKLDVYYNLAYYHTNPDSAILFSDLLINLSLKRNDPYYLSRGYLQKGYAFRYKGDNAKAASFFFKSAENASHFDSVIYLIMAYIALGDLYSQTRQHENSACYYQKAIRLTRQENDTLLLANVLINSGSEYMVTDILDSAFLNLNEARKIYEKKNKIYELALCSGNIGMLYKKMKKYPEAEENLLKAIEILTDFQDPYSITTYYNSLSDVYRALDKYPEAIRYSKNGYEMAITKGFKPYARDAAENLSALYLDKGDYKNAYKYQTLFYEYRDSCENKESLKELANLRTRYEVSLKQAEVDNLKKQKKVQILLSGFLFTLVFFGIILIIILFRNFRRKKELTKLLQEQKEELMTQQEQLEELNRTKDRFFSIISHDLRGPISAIGNFPELLMQCIEDGDVSGLSEMAGLVEESVKKVTSMLDNLLEWALSQQGTIPFHPRKIEINEIFDEIHPVFFPMADMKGIRIKNDLKEGLFVLADKNSVTTIFRNLLSNSIKFTRRGGTIVISAKEDTGYVIFKVEDNGIGMEKEKLENLFSIRENKSTWGTNKEKGLGIGLSLVNDFVKLNRGRIEVFSESGRGTIFKVFIPRYKN